MGHKGFAAARWAACCLLLTLLPARPALAALAENLGVSLDAMSLGNAVVADPRGLYAIHYNPAGLANLAGNHSSKSGFVASFSGTCGFEQPEGYSVGGWTQDPVAGRKCGKLKPTFILPGGGPIKKGLPVLAGGSVAWSWNDPGSRWTFANAIYPIAGFGYARPERDDPARYQGRYIALQRLAYLSPAVGYKISDSWQVGASFPVSYTALAAGVDARVPNILLGITGQIQKGFCPADGGSNPLDVFLFGICYPGPENFLSPYKTLAKIDVNASSNIDIGANFGALWTPSPRFSLGATYRMGSDVRLNGRYELEVDDSFRLLAAGLYRSLIGPIAAAILGIPADIPSRQAGRFQVVFPFPPVLQVGMSVRPLDTLQFNLDATRADWGRLNKVNIQFEQPVIALAAAKIAGVADPSRLTVPRGYTTKWHLGYGLRWQATERLELRMGQEFRKPSIPDDRVDLIAPLSSLTINGLGATWKPDKDTEIAVNVAWGSTRFNAPSNSSCNLNCTNFLNFIYNPYAGLNVSSGLNFQLAGVTFNKRF